MNVHADLPSRSATSRPGELAIHPIQTGLVQIKSKHVQARWNARPARALDVLADRTWAPRLPIGCWAIEHPDGLIVVDTGRARTPTTRATSRGGTRSCGSAGAVGWHPRRRLAHSFSGWALSPVRCVGW